MEKSIGKTYSNELSYCFDFGREVICENGYILVTDENGNGKPYFNTKTMEGRRNKYLWKKLNKGEGLWAKFKKKFCER